MDAMKQYKPISLVFYEDWNGDRNALPLDESKRDAFIRVIETSKMVELEWVIINTYSIKEIRPAIKTSDIEKFYYSQSPERRAYISERVRRITGNIKANVIEYFTSRGDTQKAIERMMSMVKAQESVD